MDYYDNYVNPELHYISIDYCDDNGSGIIYYYYCHYYYSEI